MHIISTCEETQRWNEIFLKNKHLPIMKKEQTKKKLVIRLEIEHVNKIQGKGLYTEKPHGKSRAKSRIDGSLNLAKNNTFY